MSSGLLVAGLAGVFSGLVLAVVVIVSMHQERQQIARGLAAIRGLGALGQTQQATFHDRVLAPAFERLAALGGRLSPRGGVERLRRQLDLAGNPSAWTVKRVLAAKGAGLLAGGLLGFWFLGELGGVPGFFLALGIPALGFFLADLLVYNVGYKRQERIQKDLADSMDLMTVSVEAGLGFDAALAQVARNTDGPLSGEFFRVLQEMQIGRDRAEAFRSLSERSTVADLGSFVSALVQADKLGIPIARVLREQSKEMRLKRRQRAEEQAMKVPVKILMPMVIFILPVLFIIILGPGAMSIMATLG